MRSTNQWEGNGERGRENAEAKYGIWKGMRHIQSLAGFELCHYYFSDYNCQLAVYGALCSIFHAV
jgi:hypothetical protein